MYKRFVVYGRDPDCIYKLAMIAMYSMCVAMAVANCSETKAAIKLLVNIAKNVHKKLICSFIH